MALCVCVLYCLTPFFWAPSTNVPNWLHSFRKEFPNYPALVYHWFSIYSIQGRSYSAYSISASRHLWTTHNWVWLLALLLFIYFAEGECLRDFLTFRGFFSNDFCRKLFTNLGLCCWNRYAEPKKILNLWTSLGFDQVEAAFKVSAFVFVSFFARFRVCILWARSLMNMM